MKNLFKRLNTRRLRITHRPTGQILAEGRLGWDITPFEGNLYIRKKCLRTDAFQVNYIPGFCPYKFFYTWLDLNLPEGRSRSLAWKYWFPNPLFPFIWFRVAVSRNHPELEIEEVPDSSISGQADQERVASTR